MATEHMSHLDVLERGSRYPFAVWPVEVVPSVAAGIYAIWRGAQLVYVGMSGRGWSAEDIRSRLVLGQKKKGLFDRLASHASGRRSGDQFCVYVCDRLVLPGLTVEEI